MGQLSRYAPKPVTIEAMRFDGDQASAHDIVAWIVSGGDKAHVTSFIQDGERAFQVCIETLEGLMTASPGDFVIRGVTGEHYPCKARIFWQTYDAA